MKKIVKTKIWINEVHSLVILLKKKKKKKKILKSRD